MTTENDKPIGFGFAHLKMEGDAVPLSDIKSEPRRDTLRKWLNEAGFDWSSGRIVYHYGKDQAVCYYEDCDVEARIELDWAHSVLDREFYSGYGVVECPAIIAQDNKALYFPSRYDGTTELVKVMLDIDHYLQDGSHTPYPGGG